MLTAAQQVALARPARTLFTADTDLLGARLCVDGSKFLSTLRRAHQPTPLVLPADLATPIKMPTRDPFFSGIERPNLLARLCGTQNRYKQALQQAQNKYECAVREANEHERQRAAALEDAKREHAETNRRAAEQARDANKALDGVQKSYDEGEVPGIIAFNSAVLLRSEYHDGFPQQFRLTYMPESKQIVAEYELPNTSVVPKPESRYARSRPESTYTSPRRAAEIKRVYQHIVASVALRTCAEIIDADYRGYVDAVVFNGYAHGVDKATGRDIAAHLISVRMTRRDYSELDLSRVDPKVCLRKLGAQISPEPTELVAIKPLIDFNMIDKRFVNQPDLLSELDSRPNLMELTPTQFEVLVSNLFSRMGLETKLTRSHRDGGVDAVAFDTRPILGGKVVIQAKRYSHTVGVSAVRDLFGTMNHEGANKGILVTTSSYGPDAYDFIKGKPIELVDGTGLLYYLDKVGMPARIVFVESTVALQADPTHTKEAYLPFG